MLDRTLLKLAGMRRVLVLLSISALVQSFLIAGQMLALAQALSNVWSGYGVQEQLSLLALFLACFIGRRLVLVVQDYFLDRYAEKQSSHMRTKLLSSTFNGEAASARNRGTAATANAATEGIDQISHYIRSIPPKLAGIAGTSIPLLAILFCLDWISSAIVLVTFPVLALFMVVLGKQAKDRAAGKFAENQRLSNRFIDTIRGIESLEALSAEERAANGILESSEALRVATVKMLSVATLSSAVLDFVTVFGVAGVAMMLAFRLMDGSVDLPCALASLMLAPECYAPIRSFASSFHDSLDGKNALAAACALLDSDETAQTSKKTAPSDPPRWSNTQTLEFKNVSFKHDGQTALSSIGFSCCGYTKIGIVGTSGSGKSTLIDLLAGFKTPLHGTIAVDGTDVDLTCDAWKSQLHYIPQHPYIFRASLEDNLKFYAPHASKQEIERAICIVGLEKLVDELPEGMATVIGNGARQLSGGEAQRIALARALLDQRPILLFDEPTAHLDIETELELKQHILPCMQGKLVFFATHRLHWVNDMDFVIVLEDGCIAEMGLPADLLAQDGALRRLVLSGYKGLVA